MTINQFRAMFNGLPGDTEVAISGAPDVTNWFSEPLPFLGTSRIDGKLIVVVGAKETTITPEEPKVTWPGRPV